MSWSSSLRPASWRGITFAVIESEADLARRSAVHEYPWRDDVWVEDLGAGRNTWAVRGRLVGDDAISLRDQMQEAVQQPGTGELIHPTFGSVIVSCIGFRTSEAWDNGRVIELEFLFIRASDRKFPSSGTSTAEGVGEAATAADAAAEGSFFDQARAAFTRGREAVNQVVTTAQSYAGMAQRLVGDAASALHSVGSIIPGADKVLGRYIRGARTIVGKVIGPATSYINRAASARKRGDYAAAATGMLASLWARQTPARAERMADMMRAG